MGEDKTAEKRGRSRGKIAAGALAVVAVAGAVAAFLVLETSATSTPAHHVAAPNRPGATSVAAPTAPTTTTPTTRPAGPGFVVGKVTAVGDSVMLDYQDVLEADIPGVAVYAAVSEQWDQGETTLEQLKAAGRLGSEVIVALGTNGPISSADFTNMMAILAGVTRVVFVNDHVDQPWQNPNNAVIAAGVSEYPTTVLANWALVAAQNPQWFASDGTHLPINGPGADALANLVTETLEGS